MSALEILEWTRMATAGFIAAAGLVFLLGGAIGVLRFPDFYTRSHAQSAAHAMGAVLVTLGLAIGAPSLAIAVRLLLLAVLIAMVSPTVTQLVAGAAHAGGLTPMVGRYRAPRPGEKNHAVAP